MEIIEVEIFWYAHTCSGTRNRRDIVVPTIEVIEVPCRFVRGLVSVDAAQLQLQHELQMGIIPRPKVAL